MKQYAVTWSGEQSRRKSLLLYPEPPIMHIQRGDGKTLCGIEMGITWRTDFQFENELNAVCKRCKSAQQVHLPGAPGEDTVPTTATGNQSSNAGPVSA